VTVGVRLASSDEDFRRFRDLVVEYEASLPEDLKHSDFSDEVDDLPHCYGPPNAALVASCDGAAIGCVALARRDAATAIVKKLYVKPACRRLGAARALMAALIETSSARGYTTLVLDTERDRLPAAYRLYRALGFEHAEPYGDVDYAAPTFMQLDVQSAR